MRRWAHRAGMAVICQYPCALLLSFPLVAAGDGWSQTPVPAWRGVVQDDTAQHIAQAKVKLEVGNRHKEAATTRTECSSLALFCRRLTTFLLM
jgi:hypothetical protein